MKKKTKVLLGVSISIIVVIIGCIIAVISINNIPKEHTVSGRGLYNLNLFIDDNFSENIEEKEKAKSETITENELLEYLEDLKSKNKIKDYKQEERGIVVDLTEGGVFIFQFDLPDGYQANSKDTVSNRNVNNLSVSEYGDTLSVLTAQPSESELQSDVFDNSAKTIENSELGYKFTDNIDNADITIDFMKTLSKYKVIIWDGHGGWFSDYHSILQIGEIHSDNIEKYSDDINSKRLIAFSNGTYAITSSFFDYYYNDNSFNGTLIYLGCCDGAMDSVLSDTLIKKGAEAVLAYNNVVYSGYNRNMCETLFNELVKKDGETNSTKTVFEAFEIAKKQNGNKDTTNTSWIDWFRGTYNKKADRAELILTENDDNSFRLVDNTTNENVDYEKIYKDYVNNTIVTDIGVCKDFDKTIGNIAENEICKNIDNSKGLSSVYIQDFNNDNIPEMMTVCALGKENSAIKIQMNLFCIENNKVVDKGVVYETDKYDNADEQFYVYTINSNDNKYFCLSDQFWYGGSSSGSIYAQYFKAISVDSNNSLSTKADVTFSYNRGNVTYKINNNDYIVAKDGSYTNNRSFAEKALNEIFTNIGLSEFSGVDMESTYWMGFPKLIDTKIYECGTKYASDYEYNAYLKDYTDFSNNYKSTETTTKETTTSIKEITTKENTTKKETTEKITSTNKFKCKLLDSGTVEITGFTGKESKLDIPSTINGKKVTSIGTRAFLDNTVLTDVTVPNTIDNIDDSAFYGCSNLKNMSIPNSVTYIGWGAFGFCTSLEIVYYTGTKEEWNKIQFDFENECLTSADIHYNS